LKGWSVEHTALTNTPTLKKSPLLTTALLLTTLFSIWGFVSTTPALALNPERHYEMVSPPYKGGYGAGIKAVAPDGESVEYQSQGLFAGEQWALEAQAEYVARRSPTGWTTTALSSPPPISVPSDYSANLQYTLAAGPLEATSLGGHSSGSAYLLHRTDAPRTVEAWDAESWELAGNHVIKLLGGEEHPGKGLYEGASADLCHIVIGRAESPLLPEAEGIADSQIYDLASAPAGGCRGDGSQPLRLVSVKNSLGRHGEPEPITGKCLALPGISSVGPYSVRQGSNFNRFSAGGEEMFFTDGVGENCALQHQLFVRLGGVRTLEVSKPVKEAEGCGEEVPCLGAAARRSADFSGASEDGARVFFTTEAQLVGEDKDESDDLYMATIGCPAGEAECGVSAREVTSLVQVSHGGEAADVQGVLRIASDGSLVYFVAHGVLSAANVEGQAPVRGAENLYASDTQTGRTAFVGDLCSGPSVSGAAEDLQCPTDLDQAIRNDKQLWGFGQEAQSTPDGRFLLFSTYARLSKGDTDNAKDLYRYDAATGALERVSLGEGGYDANGNRNDEEIEVRGQKEIGTQADATIPYVGIASGDEVFQEHEMGTRAISDAGSRIVFSTSEPLSPGVSNGLTDVYEWHEGRVSLISSGASLTPDIGATIDPSGGDVFFQTSAQLVAQDTDEGVDVYDARLGGGFPPVATERQPCSGDACQGPLTNPAPLLVPGSVSQAPGQNFAAPVSTTTVKPKPKSKPAKCKKGYVKKKGRCVKKPKKSAKGKK
jgi:hypothetical protein